MEKNLATSKKFGTRQITIIGMLSGVSIALGLSGYGFIPLPLAKATIMHIPVIIGTILEGPLVGAMIGLIFGLFSVFQNIVAPSSVLSFAFINPLVSVLPRVLIAITSYYCYKFMIGKNTTVKLAVGAVVGSLTNTFGVLTMILLLYRSHYSEVMNIGIDKAAKFIYGIALTNGIPEAIVAVVITIPVVLAVKRLRK